MRARENFHNLNKNGNLYLLFLKNNLTGFLLFNRQYFSKDLDQKKANGFDCPTPKGNPYKTGISFYSTAHAAQALTGKTK